MTETSIDPTILDPTALDSFRQLAGEQASLIIADLLQTFLEDTPSRVNKMTEALQDDDPEALNSAAHALKSASATLGAMQLSNLCAQAETLARSGSLTGAPEIVAHIYQAHETICRLFEAQLAAATEV